MKTTSWFLNYALASWTYLPTVTANSGFTWDEIATDYEKNAGFNTALAARPFWHIGKECNNWPCYPDWATKNGQITPSAKRFPWPRMDSSLGGGSGMCPWPGDPKKGEASSFPTYYTITKCCGDIEFPEFRVTYSVFWPKDGYSNSAAGAGHDYDWEDATVVWRRSKNDYKFYRDDLIMSRHKKHPSIRWTDIQSTINEDGDWTENFAKDRDHPKLYFSSAHHAVFHIQNTSHCDILIDLDDRSDDGDNIANRGDDWSHMSWPSNTIHAGGATDLGQMMKGKYGEAASDPASLQSGICGKWTRGTACQPAAGR
ncbi:MAG: hypothetical protein M1813_009067 [Trichoglossum hirsutum]|nr:MAG: hypothetical protein M1813_009067 [Trichoglossum hirsutum]